MVGSYRVVTLCGSTRFRREFEEANKRLTLAGNIVISVGLFGHSGDEEVWEGMDEDTLTQTKLMLDDMHKRKVDMADEIFVVNVGGYVGASTRSEIAYARAHHKAVRYLEPRTPVLDSFGLATPADLDALWDLYADVCEQSKHDAYSPQWELGAYPTKDDLVAYLEQGVLYAGHVDGEQRAAMVFLPHGEEASIHLLAVHPSLRGRRVGAELVDEALRLAYEKGVHVICLDVVQGNLAASRLYEAAGFRLVGTRTDVFEDLGAIEFELYEYETLPRELA